MTRRIILYTLASAALIVVDSTLLKFLAIGTIVPDILVIWIVIIAIREGQIAGTAAGFLIGLVLNLAGISGALLGLPPLAKTLAGFTAGYFYNENKTLTTLSGYQFIAVLAVGSLVHNIVYFLIFLQGSTVTWGEAVFLYGIPTTVYTVAAGLLPMFAFSRRYRS